MGKLASELKANCCGSLLGTQEKAKLVSQISDLECAFKINMRVIAVHEQQIAKLQAENTALLEQGRKVAVHTFELSYKGTAKDKLKAWAFVCLELGIEA
jgi:hypothetical protein